MNKKHPSESPHIIRQPESLKISARKVQIPLKRISQGDIFQDIKIIENIEISKNKISVKEIYFPFIVCLSQECDLETDFCNSENLNDKNMLHLAIAPAFIFEQYLNGTHWGQIFANNQPQNRNHSTIKKIIDNEIPRFHYLKFPEPELPELIIDFKHFFSINKESLYSQINKRLCSLEVLFREKINQRFSYYVSRIGLPEHLVE